MIKTPKLKTSFFCLILFGIYMNISSINQIDNNNKLRNDMAKHS